MSGRVTPKRRGQFLADEHYKRCARFWDWLYEATDNAVWAWINRPHIGDTKDSPTAAVFRPRDHFRMDGTPKVRRTLAEAQRYVQEHEDEGMEFYECSVCEAYHVGHKVRSKLKRCA